MNIEILQASSKAFLTDPLPDNWYDLTEDEQDDFLIDHAWQPIENETPADIFSLIENHANTIFELINN